MFHRLPLKVIEAALAAFNDGQMSQESACTRLGISRSRLYTLRTDWLAGGRRLPLAPSGSDHAAPWPDEAEAFLRLTLATGAPSNLNLAAAWKRVKANQGAPGIDGMTVGDFPAFARGALAEDCHCDHKRKLPARARQTGVD